jgi:DNA polymerase-1
MLTINPIFIGNTSLLDKQTTITECYEDLKNEKILSVDIETTRKYYKYLNEGLDPYTTKIVMFQIGTKEKQYVIDTRVIDITKLLPLLTDPDIVIVGQNLKFEYKHILHTYGVKIKNMYDTMLAEQVIYNDWPFKRARILIEKNKFKDHIGFSLEDLIYRYFNTSVDKSTRLEFLDIRDKAFTSRQINYGAEDILYPLMIKEIQEVRAKEVEVQSALDLEFKYISVLGNMELNGMHFSTNIWTNTYNENLIEFTSAKQVLDAFVVNNYSGTMFIDNQLDLFSTELKCNISWTSSKQVVAFFKYLEICPQEVSKTTKKLSYTVNAKVVESSLLSEFKDIDSLLKDFVHLYLAFKETEQSVTTFGIKFFKYINPITNRVHSNYGQIKRTGRSSSSAPNLQNIPASKKFRSAFSCAPGWKIVNADYGGQETLVLAEKSREANIIKLINEGGDMHSFVSSHITGKPYEDYIEAIRVNKSKIETLSEAQEKLLEERGTAKSAGFAIQFGGTGFTISKNLGLSEEKGQFVYDSYFEAFPDLKNYFEKVKKETYIQGFILIDPVTGRKQWFKKPQNNKERGAIDRKSLNSPIQGCAGNITKLAGILFSDWINKNNYNKVVKLTNIVHDELNAEVKEEYAEETAIALSECMETAGDVWVKIVKLKATAVISDYWGH